MCIFSQVRHPYLFIWTCRMHSMVSWDVVRLWAALDSQCTLLCGARVCASGRGTSSSMTSTARPASPTRTHTSTSSTRPTRSKNSSEHCSPAPSVRSRFAWVLATRGCDLASVVVALFAWMWHSCLATARNEEMFVVAWSRQTHFLDECVSCTSMWCMPHC